MKRKDYIKIAIILFLILSNIFSRPSDFYYKNYGIHDYSEWGGCSNLDIEADHVELKAAVENVPDSRWGLYTTDCGYNNNLTTNTLENESFNWYEFVLLHIHGKPDGIELPSGNGGEADMNDIGWGGGDLGGGAPPWGNGYLKWLWAHSCAWFDIKYWAPAEDWLHAYTSGNWYENANTIVLRR